MHAWPAMSTRRSKDTRSRPKSRGHQRRLQLQPLRGRYPVLPPIGGTSWPSDPYQPACQQTIMIPAAMAYPMLPLHQALPPSTMPMPMNTFPPGQPYAAMSSVPTSTLVYYSPPFPVLPYPWLWMEPNSMITELPTDDHINDNETFESCCDDSEHRLQRDISCPDPMISLKVCEEMCSQIVESVIGELVQEVVAVCIDDIVKSYLSDARLLKISSTGTERLENARHRTSPTKTSHCRKASSGCQRSEKQQLQLRPLTSQSQCHKTGAVSNIPHQAQAKGKPVEETKTSNYFTDCKEVAEHIGHLILDELLFQELLEVAVMGSGRKMSEALADGILNELLFDGCLKLLFENKGTSLTSRHTNHPPLYQL